MKHYFLKILMVVGSGFEG